jgi:hypothetical protein
MVLRKVFSFVRGICYLLGVTFLPLHYEMLQGEQLSCEVKQEASMLEVEG